MELYLCNLSMSVMFIDTLWLPPIRQEPFDFHLQNSAGYSMIEAEVLQSGGPKKIQPPRRLKEQYDELGRNQSENHHRGH